MQFNYVAYTAEGGVAKGRIEARDLEEARTAVVQQGLKLLNISAAWKRPSLDQIFPSLFRVGTGELVRFTRQLATMLGSGAGLIRTLELLQVETNNRIMRHTLGDLLNALDHGDSLSAALAQHPKIFSTLFVSVVEVGEHTGRLGPSLEQMAQILEKEHQARQKAMQALMYPLAIIGLSMITLVILMTIALPPLLEVFDELEADTPAMTRFAVAVSQGIQDNLLRIPIGFAVFIGLVILLRRISRVRYFMDAVRVKMPIFGAFTRTGELSRFSRTIAMLLEAKVSLSMALQLGMSGCKNLVIRRAFIDAQESLMSGHGMGEALKRHPILPPMFVQLVTIGEESNTLQRTMADAADTYQMQHEARLNALLGMLEPASTVVVGGIVGFIALSMFVPIYSGISAIE